MASLKRFFTRSESFASIASSPFIHLDCAAAAREMRLDERAVEMALLERPTTQSADFDLVEQEIIGRATALFRQAEREAANHFESYDERLTSLNLLANLSAVQISASQADGEMETAVLNASNRLANARAAIRESADQLRAFKASHGLTRPAHLGGPFLATTGAIFLTFAVETVANSFLLKQNDDMGLLGGVVAAATVGALNIGVAAFVGRKIFPLTHVRHSSLRYTGLALTTAWALFTLVWNLGAAHYRDAKVSGLPNPEAAALGMFGSPLDTIYSWGLLIAGILFSIIAAFSAYRMDDPYPGYGDVMRDHVARCDDYAAEVESATDELTEIRDEAIKTAQDVQHELQSQVASRGRIQLARAAFIQRLSEFHRDIETAGNQLLNIYRTANSQARTTPPPHRFTDRWHLPEPVIPLAPVITVSDNQVHDTERGLTEAVGKISDRYRRAVGSFETLESLKAKIGEL